MSDSAPHPPINVAGFPGCGMLPEMPVHPARPPLPQGVHICHVPLPALPFQVSLPAFDEITIGVQVAATSAVTATAGRAYACELQPGDFILIPPGVPVHYAAWPARAAGVLLMGVPLRLLQEAAERDLGGQPCDVELRICVAEQRDPLLHGIGWALQQAQAGVATIYQESLVAMLALHLLRYAVVRPRLLAAGRVLSPAVVRRVCEYIEAHLERELALEELGLVAEYSPYYLARLFRRATGQTLHQYVTTRRLARARLLLETTDLPLQQVAHLAGFSDQSHLSHRFRKAYGFPPNAVRRGKQAD